MYETLNLSHAAAQEMIDAIRRRLEAEKRAAAVAVRERSPSGSIGESSRTRPFPMTNYGDLRYTGWAGGLPVLVDGKVAGAIGISGLDEKAEVELGAFAVDLVTRKGRSGR